jgi:hypothetical protein
MPSIDPAISTLLAFALALIFGFSAAMKFRDLEVFESSVANYSLLPTGYEKAFAYLVPIAEAAVSIGLLMTATRTVAAIALFFLMFMFSGAIAINLARGRTNIDCGCFGPALRQELSGWLLGRNLFLMMLALATVLPESGRSMQSLDAVTIAFGALTLVVLYASANFAISNGPKLRAPEML